MQKNRLVKMSLYKVVIGKNERIGRFMQQWAELTAVPAQQSLSQCVAKAWKVKAGRDLSLTSLWPT